MFSTLWLAWNEVEEPVTLHPCQSVSAAGSQNVIRMRAMAGVSAGDPDAACQDIVPEHLGYHLCHPSSPLLQALQYLSPFYCTWRPCLCACRNTHASQLGASATLQPCHLLRMKAQTLLNV